MLHTCGIARIDNYNGSWNTMFLCFIYSTLQLGYIHSPRL